MFKKYGLVSSITQTNGFLSKLIYRKLMSKFILAKNNSSFAESLLAIYSNTKDSDYFNFYYKWVNSILLLRKKYNATPFSWDYRSKKITKNLKNYALIDCLINGYLLTHDVFIGSGQLYCSIKMAG